MTCAQPGQHRDGVCRSAPGQHVARRGEESVGLRGVDPDGRSVRLLGGAFVAAGCLHVSEERQEVRIVREFPDGAEHNGRGLPRAPLFHVGRGNPGENVGVGDAAVHRALQRGQRLGRLPLCAQRQGQPELRRAVFRVGFDRHQVGPARLIQGAFPLQYAGRFGPGLRQHRIQGGALVQQPPGAGRVPRGKGPHGPSVGDLGGARPRCLLPLGLRLLRFPRACRVPRLSPHAAGDGRGRRPAPGRPSAAHPHDLSRSGKSRRR